MKTFLIDLDGTMYRGNDTIEGAKEFIDTCIEKKIPFYFLTNNATRTGAQNVEHMEKLGFRGIKPEQFFTSAMAAAITMRKQNYKTANYIGMDGLKEALINEGFEIVEEKPECFFVGLDKNATYQTYSKGLQYCLQGAKLVGTNSDRLLAHGTSYHVGNGSIVAMFEYATGQTSPQIGKPAAPILLEALERFQLKKEDCILIGDNLETDILCGEKEGMETALVLSGVHQVEDIKRLGIHPTRVIEHLSELLLEE